MPVMKISQATMDDIKREEERRRAEFGMVLLREHESGKSLRTIAQERKTNHVTVQHLIRKAATYYVAE